jgi:hypothetical protein
VSDIALAVVFFLLSWLCFDYCSREQKEVSAPRGLLARSGSRWRFLGAGRAWDNALAWKDFYFLSGGLVAAAVKIVLFATVVVLTLWYELRNGWMSPTQRIFEVVIGVSLPVIAIELAFYASRIFYDEIRWQTLPDIAMLPVSAGWLAVEKMKGCLIALIPSVAFFLFGVLMNPMDFASGLNHVIANAEGWYAIATVVFFLHLTAYLSILMKRGAASAAFGLMFVANMIMSIMFAIAGNYMFMRQWYGLVAVLLFGAAVFLWKRIGPALERKAAEI